MARVLEYHTPLKCLEPVFPTSEKVYAQLSIQAGNTRFDCREINIEQHSSYIKHIYESGKWDRNVPLAFIVDSPPTAVEHFLELINKGHTLVSYVELYKLHALAEELEVNELSTLVASILR